MVETQYGERGVTWAAGVSSWRRKAGTFLRTFFFATFISMGTETEMVSYSHLVACHLVLLEKLPHHLIFYHIYKEVKVKIQITPKKSKCRLPYLRFCTLLFPELMSVFPEEQLQTRLDWRSVTWHRALCCLLQHRERAG